jgi:transcriptional regulator with XRE-family HTH domain
MEQFDTEASRMTKKKSTRAGDEGESEAPAANMVGNGILTLRRRRGFTLADLADRCGLDKGYLSRVERGQKSPSIAALLNISQALGVQVGHLFGERTSEEAVGVVRREEQTRIQGDSADSVINIIVPATDQRRISAFIVEVSASPREKGADHAGDEFVHVLKGEISVCFPDREIHLKAGDSAYFDGHLQHQMMRQGHGTAEVLIVVAQDLP